MFKYEVLITVAEEKINEVLIAIAEELHKFEKNNFTITFANNKLYIEISDIKLFKELPKNILSCGIVNKFTIENRIDNNETNEFYDLDNPASIVAETERIESILSDAVFDEDTETESFTSVLHQCNQENESSKENCVTAQENEIKAKQFKIIDNNKKNNAKLKSTKKVKSQNTCNKLVPKKFSREYVKKIYQETKNTQEFGEKLAEYLQLSEDNPKEALIALISAVEQTDNVSWFNIENRVNSNKEITSYNHYTKKIIAKNLKEIFDLTMMKFLKEVKNIMKSSKTEAKNTVQYFEDINPVAKETIEMTQQCSKSETNQQDPKEENFDEYWSSIFSCMPKIITSDTQRINKISNIEKQLEIINKRQSVENRVKEVLEIMEEPSLISDECFVSFSRNILMKKKEIVIRKETPLYEKMRFLQWSKLVQKFVFKYYTDDPNFRVDIARFLTELREIIMTAEEKATIK